VELLANGMSAVCPTCREASAESVVCIGSVCLEFDIHIPGVDEIRRSPMAAVRVSTLSSIYFTDRHVIISTTRVFFEIETIEVQLHSL